MTKSEDRTKTTGEVFTPLSLVNEMIDKIPNLSEVGITVLDNSCGNGQFLSQAFIRKSINYSNLEDICKDIYGVDLMADNTADTVARLAVLQKYGIDIVDENAQFRINHDEYHDNHNRAWLEQNFSTFKRRYHGKLEGVIIDLVVKFAYFDDGDAGVFRYIFIDGETAVNPNIVCQDALKYNYCFSKGKSVLQF
jgi:type I restriction-modification system DNA methylase subunit